MKKYIKPTVKVKFVDTEQLMGSASGTTNTLEIKPDAIYENTQDASLNAKGINYNIWEDEDENE